MKFTLDQLLCSFSLVNWTVKQKVLFPLPQVVLRLMTPRLTVHLKSPELSFGCSDTSSGKLPGTVALQSLCVAHCSQSNREGTNTILLLEKLRTLVGREAESMFWRCQNCFAQNVYNYCPKDLIKLKCLCFFMCALKSWVQVTVRLPHCR